METTIEITRDIRKKARDYMSGVSPIWCPGCGDYGVLACLSRALAALDIAPKDIAIASGIGCSGRFPAFIKSYGYHGCHGRALPMATGMKLGNPDLHVFAMGGDGDGFSIGSGHLAHTARRNIDLTYVVMDNSIYGLTKGQPSPTSPVGLTRKASPYGIVERPVNPVAMMLSFGASFVARAYSGDSATFTEIFIRAIRHEGFAFVHVISPCVTYHKAIYEEVREHKQELPADHNSGDRRAAMTYALDMDTPWLGIFYEEGGPDYQALLNERDAPYQEEGYGVEDMLAKYRVGE